MQADDYYWRRPDPSHADPTGSGHVDRTVPADPAQRYSGHQAQPEPTRQPEPARPPYSPPPPTIPPPAGWHPEHIIEAPPPRRLPPQDDQRIDLEEARARTITLGTGIVVGVILLLLLCALCGRVLA